MKNYCIVNKRSVVRNKELKRVQRKSRRYYQEKLFQKAGNAPKARIGKFCDLSRVEYKIISDTKFQGMKKMKLSREELIYLCEKSSLTGRSGNGFLVSKKLEALHKRAGILIINAVECDSGLATDSWLYRNRREWIEYGAELLKDALCLEKIILATKEPIQKIEGIEQLKVPDRFPMGYENYLIKHTLNVEIKENELPQNKGILVMNLQTVIAIAELAQDSRAGQYKYITVANLYTAEAKVARVRIGDYIKEAAAGCFPEKEWENCHIYVGGGAFNCHEAVGGDKISDTTGYIAIGQMPSYEAAERCKGCGACTRNCPAGVEVQRLIKHVQRNGMRDADECARYRALYCIGCGACTYGCVAGKDVRGVVTWAKEKLS